MKDLMKFTPAQCRRAFYQAAANIEARPELYDFCAQGVGYGNCPACMWGHVGRAMGLPGDTPNVRVAVFAGISSGDTKRLYDFKGDNFGHSAAAAKLRAFAGHHWPAESTEPVRPNLKECGMSFAELLHCINGETA